MKMRRSASHDFPLAIARGEAHTVQRLLKRQLSNGPSLLRPAPSLARSVTMDFCCRGATTFGTTITYEISPLGLAVCYRKWRVFRALLAAGIDPNRHQKVLLAADCTRGQHYVAEFASALELFLYAAVRPTYFPPALPDSELMAVLSSLVEQGADLHPSALRPAFLRRLCSAVCLDLWRHVWGTDASTAIAREAASLLRYLVKNGLQSPPHLFLDYHSLDDNLYLVLMALLDRDLAYAAPLGALLPSSGRRGGHLPRAKLRSILVLTLNLFLSNAVLLPPLSACDRLPRLTATAATSHDAMHRLFARRPLKLAFLARRQARHALGTAGGFQERLARLPVPEEERRFIAYLEEKDVTEELAVLLPPSLPLRPPPFS